MVDLLTRALSGHVPIEVCITTIEIISLILFIELVSVKYSHNVTDCSIYSEDGRLLRPNLCPE